MSSKFSKAHEVTQHTPLEVKTTDIQYSSYSDWKPQDYLAEYYQEVMLDQVFTLEFILESLQKIPEVSIALDFGCGPGVQQILPLIPKVQEIHLAEYLPANRTEVEKWLSLQNDAYNWQAFTLETLRLQGSFNPTEVEALAHEQEVRNRTKRILPCDVTQADPLGLEFRGFYSLVMSNYCADAVSTSKESWRTYIKNIASLVKLGGVLLLSSCGGASFYRVGNHYFPGANIDEHDVLACLQDNNFTEISLKVRQVPHNADQGFSSVIFAYAIKR